LTTDPTFDAAALIEQLAALDVPAACVDEDGRIGSANPLFLQMTNASSGAVVDRGLNDFLEATSLEHNAYGDGAVYRFSGPKGDRWLRPRRSRAHAGAVVMLIDVTSEWAMLGKLVSAVEVRDRLMRDADVGMWRFDPDTKVFSYSEAIGRRNNNVGRTSSPLEEMVSTMHPDDVEREASLRERIISQGGTGTLHMRRRKPDGGWRHTLVQYCSGRQLPSGRYEVFGLSQNITELVDARDAANSMHDRLEIAMSAARAGVYEIDMQSSERWTSPQYQELAGSEALARGAARPFGMYHDDDILKVKESWDRCFLSGEVEWVDTRLYRPHGDEQWVRVFSRVQRNEKGVQVRAIGLMLDIQEQKQQELALIEAKKQAEAATVAKSNFLASMSHEIRTPLNGVLGMAQSLVADGLNESQIEKVNVILDSGKTLTALLNDVLDLSKIEAGKIEIATVDGELAVTFDRLRQLFLQRAVERGLNIDLELPTDLPQRLHYDPVRVRQCVGNLLSNAIKFTERGVVKMKVGAKETHPGCWMISVAVVDTGIGMNEATRSKLFSTFTQADASITRRFGGSGLGLAITRQLARLMGGDVTVDSEPGLGSTFTLTFLAEAVNADALAPGDDLPPPPAAVAEVKTRNLRGIKILLVDDNAVNRQVAKLFTAQFSPKFVEAINGQEALDRLHDEAFDLVLLDVHMPVMDGKETIRRIRSSAEPWRDIPVIALTADAMSGDRERYLALGMSDYVSKPLDQKELAAKITAAVGERPLLEAKAA
jgi:signal transduction histidine kinase/ActR/RegA family two-component response regulator